MVFEAVPTDSPTKASGEFPKAPRVGEEDSDFSTLLATPPPEDHGKPPLSVHLTLASPDSVSTGAAEVVTSVADQERKNATTLLYGLSLMLLSAFLFSLMSLLVNVLPYPTEQLLLSRFSVQSIASLVHLKLLRLDRPFGNRQPRRMLLLFLRGAFGTAGMFCFFTILSDGRFHLPLSAASCLIFTNPILVAILARLLMKEQYGFADAAAAGACMTGVLLIARPWSAEDDTDISPSRRGFATLIGLMGALFAAMALVTIRFIGNKEHSVTVVFWFGFVGLFASGIACAVRRSFEIPSALGAVGLLGLGIGGYSGQLSMGRGLQLVAAGPASTLRYADIVFGAIYQATLLGEPISPWTAAGAVLITSCVLKYPLAAWRERSRLEKLAHDGGSLLQDTEGGGEVEMAPLDTAAEGGPSQRV